jgi:hypothetical protein
MTDYPPPEDSLAHLHRSGWSMGEAGFTGSSGRTVHQVDGANGENRIRVEGATPAEAWRRAVEAAAACGMLADWPRPARRIGDF